MNECGDGDKQSDVGVSFFQRNEKLLGRLMHGKALVFFLGTKFSYFPVALI